MFEHRGVKITVDEGHEFKLGEATVRGAPVAYMAKSIHGSAFGQTGPEALDLMKGMIDRTILSCTTSAR